MVQMKTCDLCYEIATPERTGGGAEHAKTVTNIEQQYLDDCSNAGVCQPCGLLVLIAQLIGTGTKTYGPGFLQMVVAVAHNASELGATVEGAEPKH